MNSYYFNMDSSAAYFFAGAQQFMYFLFPSSAQSYRRLRAEVELYEKKEYKILLKEGDESISLPNLIRPLKNKLPLTIAQLTGIGFRFGDSSSLSALTVVPATYIGYTSDLSFVYGFAFNIPLNICPSTSSNIQYATFPVQSYALTSMKLLSRSSQSNIDVVCGDPPSANSFSSIITNAATASPITANDCNNGVVAGADSPVTRFFTLGAIKQVFTFSY
jgi:hypothetical protein